MLLYGPGTQSMPGADLFLSLGLCSRVVSVRRRSGCSGGAWESLVTGPGLRRVPARHWASAAMRFVLGTWYVNCQITGRIFFDAETMSLGAAE